jgi:hypothetical protein
MQQALLLVFIYLPTQHLALLGVAAQLTTPDCILSWQQAPA